MAQTDGGEVVAPLAQSSVTETSNDDSQEVNMEDFSSPTSSWPVWSPTYPWLGPAFGTLTTPSMGGEISATVDDENSATMDDENSATMGGENSATVDGENSAPMGGENSATHVAPTSRRRGVRRVGCRVPPRHAYYPQPPSSSSVFTVFLFFLFLSLFFFFFCFFFAVC